MRQGTRVVLRTRGLDRYGFVETETSTGRIIRLDDGSSAFIAKVNARRYNRGDCIAYGLFNVQTVSER